SPRTLPAFVILMIARLVQLRRIVANTDDFTLRASGFVDGLADVHVLREPSPEEMRHHVPHLKARVLQCRRRPMARSRNRPHQTVSAWLEHAIALAHHLGEPRNPLVATAFVRVPFLAHEADTRGRIRDEAVER